MQLDTLDGLAAHAFDGYIVRKDLARRFKGQYPVPTYVGEFLLGRYCASTDEDEIQEGLRIVQLQLANRAVRAGEKGATSLLMPVSARKQLFDLSDDMATKITIQFYSDPREALLKALGD